MATKTVINCMDNTLEQPNQGISIIIDQQHDNLPSQNDLVNSSPNIIQIQHSCDQSSSNHLLSLSSTRILNNKTSIDINRNNNSNNDDHHHHNADHVLQINCTTSNEISREIKELKENSDTIAKLECNGLTETGDITNGNGDDHDDDHNAKEKLEIDNNEVKEFTKYKQHNYHHSPEDEEESGQTTSQQKATTQFQPQQQQVNNGNSKYRDNGHFIQNYSTTKLEHNDHEIQHNAHDDNDDDDDGHYGNKPNNEVTSIGEDIGVKRVNDFSHGKRSFNEENSNSLITKADAFTTTTLTINQLTDKENLFKPTKTNTNNLDSNLKEIPENHVVKIQIKPKNSKTEKQITVVKIENLLEKPQENSKALSEITENLCKKELNQEPQESVITNEKMVQKPSKNNNNHKTVTVTSNTHTSSSSSSGNATVSNTGSTTVTELNVSNTNYLYYMMSSGQFSPSDTLDSGTGSDLESNGQQLPQQQSSPSLLTKKSSNTLLAPLEMHIKTTKIRVTNSAKSKDIQQQRQCSFTDSEESEASSLSCDSLHSNEFLRQQSTSPIDTTASTKKIQTFLPDSLLREIKNLKFSSNDYEAENEEEDDILPQLKTVNNHIAKANTYELDNTYETINTQDYIKSQSEYVQTRNNLNNSSISLSSSLKRASLPSKTFVLNTEDGTFIDTKMNSMPRTYEADKYYNFHVNEHDNFRSFGNNSSSSLNGDGDSLSIANFDIKSLQDDVFAGYKDIRGGSNTSTIRSSKGTVRGVKNRVRNGIATFLQLQQPNVKNYKEKDSGKVVLYTTSMGIIRDTYAKCANVKQILRTLLVKFEERDVFMSVEYQQEIKERMHSDIIKVPQLYVEGQHIGDADTVERLNESGELRQLLKPYKSISTIYTCQTCGGYRLLPCPSCNGSKKSVHRNHFTAEFVALKCMNCDEVGLVKCHNC